MAPTAENRSIFGRVVEKLSHLVESAASRVFGGRDSRAVANYMLARAVQDERRLTVMHLLKLVYLAHGWRLGLTGRPLIRDQVEAWMLGPVVPRVYEEFRPGTLEVRCPLRSLSDVLYWADFTDSECETMDMVYDMYSPLSAYQLSDLTHEPDTPWDQVKVRGEFPPIPNEVIRDYYRARIEEEKSKRGA